MKIVSIFSLPRLDQESLWYIDIVQKFFWLREVRASGASTQVIITPLYDPYFIFCFLFLFIFFQIHL